MDAKQILRHIDDGANYYISLFGHADHMELVDNGCYTYVMPKEGQPGITFVYNIHLESLPLRVQEEKITEIKSLNMPIWFDLLASDELFRLMFGKEKIHHQTVFDEHDEVYQAILPEEKPDYSSILGNANIVRVRTAEEFTLWAKITNDVLSGGYSDIHPVYHYPLCQKGLLKCIILYKNDVPAAVAAIADNSGIASLEFVATIPEMRRQGLAQTVCAKAVEDAFNDGAKIITVRAVDAVAKKIYESLGFSSYNHAL